MTSRSTRAWNSLGTGWPQDSGGLDRVGESAEGMRGSVELPGRLPDETRESLRCWVDSGLEYPFIPREFADRTYPVGEWAWGTRSSSFDAGFGQGESVAHPLAAYLQSPELDRFVAGDWRPRFFVCHAGQGVNSYAINYLMVTGRIALFAQAGWGGVYMDKARAASHVNRMGELIAEVHQAVDSVVRWPAGRLVVVDSDFRGQRPIAWVPSPGQQPDPIPGDFAPGLRGAVQYLSHLAESP